MGKSSIKKIWVNYNISLTRCTDHMSGKFNVNWNVTRKNDVFPMIRHVKLLPSPYRVAVFFTWRRAGKSPSYVWFMQKSQSKMDDNRGYPHFRKPLYTHNYMGHIISIILTGQGLGNFNDSTAGAACPETPFLLRCWCRWARWRMDEWQLLGCCTLWGE